MARLTEEMVIARSKQSDLAAIKKLNCWGAELGDVSLLRRMPNVEVLALSINKIRSLEDFAGCRRLRELYVRKNEIGDLREIRHLRRLPELTSLWLDENPCTDHPEYRMTVLRNLPNLEKLDNVPVHPDEVNEAMRRGHHIADSDDEGYAPQESYGGPPEYTTGGRRASAGSDEQYNGRQYSRVPDQGSDSSEGAEPPPGALQSHQSQSQLQSQSALTVTCEKREECPMSPTRRYGGTTSPDNDDRYEIPPAMTRSHYEARTVRSPEEPTVRHSVSAHSVKEYSYGSNGDYRHAGERTPPQYQEQYHEHRDRDYAPSRCPAESYERERDRDRERDTRERDREREFPSAVMGEHRGFTRRPVTRNSNLLSAVLCLVKELDYPSLEVAEMAVRCRMDELANSQ